MAKVNVKQLLVDKGERYAVYGAGVLTLLLLVLGIMRASDKPLPNEKTPEEFISEVEIATNQVSSGMNKQAEKPDLGVELGTDGWRRPVTAAAATRLYFDPNAPPDNRRINPVVLRPTEIEAAFMPAKIWAYDIIDAPDGTQQIAVYAHKLAKGDVDDKEKKRQFLDDLQKRGRYRPPPKAKQPAGGALGFPGGMTGGPLGIPGGMAGGAPRGPSGGMGMIGTGPGGMLGMPPSGALGMGPSGGVFGASGGMPPTGMGGKPGMPTGGVSGPGMSASGMRPGYGTGFAPIETGERMGVEYVPLDPDKLEGKRLALTIYPQRLVVVHAAFPYKAQIKEIQNALRLDKEADVFTTPDAAPQFRGFVVERQVLLPDGRVDAPWKVLDVETNYRETIFPRKFGDKDEDPGMQYVMLNDDHELTMPLPLLLSGKYPDIGLNSIITTVQRLSAQKKPAIQHKPSQLKGEGNVFRKTQASPVGGMGQPPTNEAGFPSLTFKPKAGTGNESEMGKDGTSQTVAYNDLPDSVLVRFLDNDIAPGRLYQYRVRIKMQNPNWAGKKDEKGKFEKAQKIELVSRPSDAEVEIIEGPPVQMGSGVIADVKLEGNRVLVRSDNHDLRTGQKVIFATSGATATAWPVEVIEANVFAVPAAANNSCKTGANWAYAVSVPQEDFLFAVDPPVDAKGKPAIAMKPGEAMLQVQRWLPMATVGNYKEPVADWVVADVLAKRGHHLGGKQFVSLPIWDSLYNRYILREPAPEKAPKIKGQPRRGVEMDPTKPGPSYVVVEVKGGLSEERTPSKIISDESAAEVLLLDESGNLQVRSSASDRADTGRAKREEAWREWVDKTDKETEKIAPTPMPKGGKGPDYDK